MTAGPGGGRPDTPDPGFPPDTSEMDESGEPIGPFPTWKALYATVLVWWAFMVVMLWVFTVVFDRGVP